LFYARKDNVANNLLLKIAHLRDSFLTPYKSKRYL
jgi:hypothetical protein